MRELNATVLGEASTSIAACYERLADVEAYPSWYPAGVRYAETLERDPDGIPTRIRTTFVLARFGRDFTLEMGVGLARPSRVELRRLPKREDDPEMVVIRWRLRELEAERTEVAVDVEAALDIPRFLPIGGVGESIAKGFLDAAVASFTG